MRTKAQAQLSLSAFPKDGLIWQVVGHGKIRAPTEVDEAACEVSLAEAGWDKVSWQPPAAARTCSIWIGLGQLPLTPVGSLWRDGTYLEQAPSKASRVEVVGTSKKWSDLPLGRTAAYQLSPTAPWTPAYPLAEEAAAPLFLVMTGDGGMLWVPAIEVARATFGVTSQWLRLMIEGGMDIWPDLRGRIIDPKRSGRYGEAGRSLRVWAYRGLDDLDVLAAARICAEHGLRYSFNQVCESLRRNGFGRGPTHVRIPFPFARPSTWTVETRWVGVRAADGQLKKRHLVTRILHIEYDLGLDHVRVFHPGRVESDEGEVPLDTSSQRLRLRAQGDISQDVQVITGQASWAALGVMQKTSLNQRASGGWTIEHIPVEPEELGAGKTAIVPVDGPIRAATTAGHGPKSERRGRLAIKLNIKDKVQAKMDVSRPPPARIASTIAALEKLSVDLRRELEIVAPKEGPGSDRIDGLWRYPTDSGAGVLHWATTREGRQRRALVARLRGDRGWIYFFEAEHLEIESAEPGSGPSSVIGQDGYSALCVLSYPGGDLMSADMIGDLLRVNALSRGVWRRPGLALPMTTVRRANAWLHDHGSYARAIKRAIGRLEGNPAAADPS